MRALLFVSLTFLAVGTMAQGWQGGTPPNHAITYAQRAHLFGPGQEMLEPFRIVGNLYYVGAVDIASFLITTPDGHIVIDSGTTLMAGEIAHNIERLGLDPEDVKILLNSHAHVDHIQGMGVLKRITGGADVMIMEADSEAARTGIDLSAIHADGWEPIPVDRVLKDNDTVSLGGVTLRAIWTPGHTPGTTAWVMNIQEDGKSYQIIFGGPPTPLLGHPTLSTDPDDADTAFRRLRELNPDIQLSGHPMRSWEGKIEPMRAGHRPHPLLLSAGQWEEQLDGAEARYRERLAEQ